MTKFFRTLATIAFPVWLIGLLVLFKLNPNVYPEIDNLAFSNFNYQGMDGEYWATIVLYIMPGILSLVFFIHLLSQHREVTQIIGLVSLIIASVFWISFGYPIDKAMLETDHQGYVLLRTILFLLTAFIGYLFFGIDRAGLTKNRGYRLATLILAGTAGILGFLSVFILVDETWMRTNLSIVLFFVWVSLSGLVTLLEKKTTANKH